MIKKIIVAMLLAYGTVASAGTYYIDDAKKMKVDTPYNLSIVDGVTDLELAIYMGKVDYIQAALKVDPLLIQKINNVMGVAPDSPLGFNPKNPEMLNFMLQHDQGLLSRKNSDKRNILINLLVQHYEFYHSDEPKKELDRLLNEFANKKLPFIKEAQNALSVGRPVPEMEKLALHVANMLSPQALNEADKWGNNALSYAIYIRKPNLVKGLLNNHNFKSINAQNYMGENPLFMLLNHNCNVTNDKKAEEDILKALLSSRANALQKNVKGVSFAGMVFAFDEFSHFKQILADNLGPFRLKLIQKEADYIKTVFAESKSNSKAVKDSFASSFSNSREYTAYTCDVSKLKY